MQIICKKLKKKKKKEWLKAEEREPEESLASQKINRNK